MRIFTKVSPTLWASTRFRSLPCDRDRLWYIYTLTSRHQTSAGVCILPDEYGAADLKWNLGDVTQARQNVTGAGMVFVDEVTAEVFVDQWFRHNGACNDKHAQGIAKYVADITSDAIREEVETQFQAAEEVRERDKQRKAAEKAEKDKAKQIAAFNSNVGGLAITRNDWQPPRGKG